MPDSGDTFLVVADRDKAKGIAQYRKMKERDAQLAKSSRVSLEGLAEQIRTAGVKDLPLIIKGDVTGSVEVLADSLVLMSTEKVRVKVIHSGVGSITESDVLLATASNTIIIGFNVRPERKAAELAQQEGVQIRLHSIIYELQDEMRLAMLGLLDPTFKENYLGRAEVSTSSAFPRSAPSPAAACRTASSAATPRSRSCAAASRSSRARSAPSSASRTTPAKSPTAWSAASASAASTTSRKAT
jgi:translation initiation factor IF-2